MIQGRCFYPGYVKIIEVGESEVCNVNCISYIPSINDVIFRSRY